MGTTVSDAPPAASRPKRALPPLMQLTDRAAERLGALYAAAEAGKLLDHLARVLQARYVRRRSGRRRVHAHALQEIGAIQPRPSHPHPDMNRRQGRIGHLHQVEDLGTAWLANADGAHGREGSASW